MAGPRAATAEPPQMAVLVESKLDNFQFTLKSRPNTYPPPKAVERVNAMRGRAYFPTINTCEKLSVMPIKTIPSFKTFDDTNCTPDDACGIFCKTGCKSMPKISARMLESTICPGRIL